ncbi:MAG: 30S ribosomal protein S6 [Candidatus Electryonea clarkiae]|nr:30S ribosomal protein S6 [Candidatus Electryonea clarkiae]MDP8287580.1 30S ribosomal protein S6 [Candidatus Electryonea clarkiae]
MATMHRYEMLVLIDASLSEEGTESIISHIKEMIVSAEGGELVNIDRWGKKRLAYEIKKKQFGYYVQIEFISPTGLPSGIDRYCRLENSVIRHLILNIPERALKLKAREEKIRAAMGLRRNKVDEETEVGHVKDSEAPITDLAVPVNKTITPDPPHLAEESAEVSVETDTKANESPVEEIGEEV